MKKRKITILASLSFVVLAFAFETRLSYAESGDKACVYTVDTPDSIRVDCFGSGSVCNSVANCPAPQIGFL